MTEEATYNEMRNKFQEVFFKKFSQGLVLYEEDRKKRLLYIKLILASVAIIIVLSVVFLKRIDCNIIAILTVLAAAGSIYMKKSFEKNLKSGIMPQFCKCFGNLKWSSGSYTDSNNLFRNSYLIPEYEISSYDDIFKGSYKEVGFEIVESTFSKFKKNKFEKHYGSHRPNTLNVNSMSYGDIISLINAFLNPKKSQNKVFSGVIIKLTMNKNFTGKTLITPDTMLHATPSKELKHTTLEDVVFEKKFDVFTDD